MKYLDLVLDSRWSFAEHFRRLASRAERMSEALAGLLPNLGGPGGTLRRLFAGVVNSVLAYGAPVWAGDIAGKRTPVCQLRKVHRRMGKRIARAYRTVGRMRWGSFRDFHRLI